MSREKQIKGNGDVVSTRKIHPGEMRREIGTVWKDGRWWKIQMHAGIETRKTLQEAKTLATIASVVTDDCRVLGYCGQRGERFSRLPSRASDQVRPRYLVEGSGVFQCPLGAGASG
jgi:hypothetical protein